MKFKQPVIKLASILMMFVLTQKIACGLYLHSWLHSSKNTAAITHGSKAVSPYNCSCIDDFYAPFTGSVKVSVEPPQFLTADYLLKEEKKIPVSSKLFSSLRAPPAA